MKNIHVYVYEALFPCNFQSFKKMHLGVLIVTRIAIV